MDDYALQQELEALAGNAWQQPSDNSDLNGQSNVTEPIGHTIRRWSQVFGLPPDEAVDLIVAHRNNLTRTRISDEHWDSIRSIAEPEGHDKESYEYGLELQKRKAALPDLMPTEGKAESTVTYFVELSGPLSTAQHVQQAADMDEVPKVVEGSSVERVEQVKLCSIDGKAKNAILKWASEKAGGWEPTILVNPTSLVR